MPLVRAESEEPSHPTVAPGAVTALLQELAAAPDEKLDELPAFSPGQVVGRFEILREIGRGGFGVVYEARDPKLGRMVALKVVRANGKLDVREERLLREAEAAARLAHPNIVTLYDVGSCDQGPYLVLEFLHGETLAARLREGALPVRDALRIAVEVSKGLAHAHAQGVVHRDLTPGNVFLCDDGQVKVLDFGMAHAFGRRKVDGGTRAYMAPEQALGAPEDERTDVFALGVVLYQMLSGKLPFTEREALEGARLAQLLEVGEAPELAGLAARMLEKDPVKRPRDAGEVLAALTRFQQALARVPAAPSAPVRTQRRPASLADLLAELKRRRVTRALVAYAVISFAILQVIEPVMHGLHVPDSLLSVVVVLLGIGFPITVALAWVFDLTAGGIARTPAARASGLGGARLALLLVGLGVLAATPGLIRYFLRRERAQLAASNATTQLASPAVPAIAVLPFVDMSPQHDQEYFADGMAEEILNALTHVRGLQLVGRTSSFSFKGKSDDLRAIGQKLNASAILEGSVRRESNRVRITAQLINVADGFHVWSESYDRDLTSIFLVQEEIARSVVGALRVRLMQEQVPTSNQHRTASVEAYTQYLLGRQFHARQTRDGYRHAVQAYENAIALDPSYAPARAQLAISLRAVGFDVEDRMTAAGLRNRALAEAERAVALRPDLEEAYASRGLLRMGFLRDWNGAQSDFRRALELSPNDPPSHRRMGLLLASQGRLAEAIAAVERATELDPLDTTSWLNLGTLRAASGRFELARKAQLRVLEISPASEDAHDELAVYDLVEGRPAEALARTPAITKPERLRVVAIAEHELGHPKEAQRALDELIRLRVDHEAIAQVYAWRRDAARAINWLVLAVDEEHELWDVKFDPILARIRDDVRFKELLRKMNLPVE